MGPSCKLELVLCSQLNSKFISHWFGNVFIVKNFENNLLKIFLVSSFWESVTVSKKFSIAMAKF